MQLLGISTGIQATGVHTPVLISHPKNQPQKTQTQEQKTTEQRKTYRVEPICVQHGAERAISAYLQTRRLEHMPPLELVGVDCYA